MFNNMTVFQNNNHTCLDSLINWCMKPDFFHIFCNNESKLVQVNNVDKMSEMSAHLVGQTELAIDCEFDNNTFFRDCNGLLQVFCNECDYIIDLFKVFPSIKSMLQPIFTNPDILKIVISNNDVKAFQRHYDLWFVGVFDVQSIRQKYYGLSQPESLATVVKKELDISMDKSFQRSTWINRPLPINIIKYARFDTKYLLKAWNFSRNQS